MPYQINGANMGIAPYQQTWVDIIQGRDHTGRPIYANTKSVTLNFDAAGVSLYSGIAALNGASLTSIQLLNLDGSSFNVYNNANIFLEVNQRPSFEAAYANRWSVTINGIVIS